MSKIIEITYFGSVDENGILKIKDRRGFDKYLLQFKEKDVTIDIKRKKSKRSLQQNRFFHSWCNLLAEELGYSKDEIKEILKFKFLRVEEINDITGDVFTYTKETSKLNKMEFADFCSEIQQWTKDKLNITLPLPDENWMLTF